MTKLVRWDNGETIHECDGSLAETVMAAAKLGISCFRSNLSDANLLGADLSGANLIAANLSDANLLGADLSGANLSDANLIAANLSGADLSGATLSGADLSGANLREADLSVANLREADLLRADLSGANLSGADLSGATLIVANLSGADLSGANLPIYCKWAVSYKLANGAISVSIGCKTKIVHEWDNWFAGTDEFETPRDSEDFRRIRANYLAMRTYLVTMGLHTESA